MRLPREHHQARVEIAGRDHLDELALRLGANGVFVEAHRGIGGTTDHRRQCIRAAFQVLDLDRQALLGHHRAGGLHLREGGVGRDVETFDVAAGDMLNHPIANFG